MEWWWIAAGLVGAWVLFTALALGLERVLGRGRRIWALEAAPGQVRWEVLASLRFLVLCTVAIALARASGGLRFAPAPGHAVAHFALTWGFTWVVFEVWYYGLHRALHTARLYRFHEHHHRSRVTTPYTGFSLSVVESLGWIVGMVAPPMLLALVAPVSLAGWLTYVACNFYVNIAGHINAEMMPSVAGTRGASWLTHPVTYHALHHARFRTHYSFCSSFMDRLLGTESPDWPALHQRVTHGQPLERFSVRG